MVGGGEGQWMRGGRHVDPTMKTGFWIRFVEKLHEGGLTSTEDKL